MPGIGIGNSPIRVSGNASDLGATFSASLPNDSLADMQSSPLGSLFLGTAEKDYRDWYRGEVSADNALQRSLAQLQVENDFNASQAQLNRDYNAGEAQRNRDFQSSEAQKQRDWDEYMARNSYQIAMESMKEAGLNPILAYRQGGADVPNSGLPQGSQASSSPAQSGHGGSFRGQSAHSTDSLGAAVAILSGVANLVSGMYSMAGNAVEGYLNRLNRREIAEIYSKMRR